MSTGALDKCGVCGGDNACTDCAGQPYGSALTDHCGQCDGNATNDCMSDCRGSWGGPKEPGLTQFYGTTSHVPIIVPVVTIIGSHIIAHDAWTRAELHHTQLSSRQQCVVQCSLSTAVRYETSSCRAAIFLDSRTHLDFQNCALFHPLR